MNPEPIDSLRFAVFCFLIGLGVMAVLMALIAAAVGR